MRMLTFGGAVVFPIARLAVTFVGRPLGLRAGAGACPIIRARAGRAAPKTGDGTEQPYGGAGGKEKTKQKKQQQGGRGSIKQRPKALKFNRERCQGVLVHEYPIRKAI
jgi:hypothetical protein